MILPLVVSHGWLDAKTIKCFPVSQESGKRNLQLMINHIFASHLLTGERTSPAPPLSKQGLFCLGLCAGGAVKFAQEGVSASSICVSQGTSLQPEEKGTPAPESGLRPQRTRVRCPPPRGAQASCAHISPARDHQTVSGGSTETQAPEMVGRHRSRGAVFQ